MNKATLDMDILQSLIELWNSHFSLMLTCVSILLGVFGIGCPLLFSVFQRKNLQDERAEFNKLIDKYKDELKNNEDKLKKQEERIEETEKILREAHIALGQFYIDGVQRSFHSFFASPSDDKVSLVLHHLWCALTFMCRSNITKGNLLELLAYYKLLPTRIAEKDHNMWKKGVKLFLSEFPKMEMPFISYSELEAFIGRSNKTLEEFKEAYQEIFDALDS